MSGPQFMPFYVGDYLRDTMHLTREQHGVYLLLLFACWSAGGKLPNDDNALAAIAKATLDEWKSLKPLVISFFRISRDGFWVQKRLIKELQKIQHLHDVRSKAGSKGGSKTSGKNKHARAFQSHSHSHIQLASNEANDSPPSGGRAPDGRAAPPDDELNEQGVALLGRRKRGLIRQMRVRHGDDRVRAALAATERRQPAELVPYFLSCCEKRQPGPDPPLANADPPPPPKPVNPKFLGHGDNCMCNNCQRWVAQNPIPEGGGENGAPAVNPVPPVASRSLGER